ncbi:hypothetical protein C8R44DRAFT_885445 [Mycena epipterygia]|nr:hypothetical protein C8R44DRAFT_885445 [Mycena epipterygia]
MNLNKRNPGNARDRTPSNSAPNTSGTAKLTTRTTRAKTDAPGEIHARKTRAELYAESDLDWEKFKELDALEHLYAKGFVPEGVDSGVDFTGISLILLRIAASVNSMVTADACRALAVIIEKRKLENNIDDIARDVRALLYATNEADECRHADNEADAPVAESLCDAANVLTRTVHEQCGELETLTERLGEGLTGLIERAQEVPEQMEHTRATDNQLTTKMYATAAAALPPPEHAVAVAAAAARTRQIVIEWAPNTQEWLV